MFIKITKELEEYYLDKIKKFLIAGKTTTTIQKKRGRKVRSINLGIEDGLVDFQPLERHLDYSELTTIKHEETPDFVMHLIADSMSVEKAIEFLMSKGYVVLDPSVQENNEVSNQGISAQTIEQIKSSILGVE